MLIVLEELCAASTVELDIALPTAINRSQYLDFVKVDIAVLMAMNVFATWHFSSWNSLRSGTSQPLFVNN